MVIYTKRAVNALKDFKRAARQKPCNPQKIACLWKS